MTGCLNLACKDCAFYVPQVTRGGTGECRRNPPTPAFEPTGTPTRVTAVVGAYYWCGEHSSVLYAIETWREAGSPTADNASRAAALLDKGPEENPTLSSLIEQAKGIRMTPEQERKQRLSFVYGNTHIDNPNVTRQMVEDADKKIGKGAENG